MNKAVIYARYSTSNQTENTIEAQVRACENYAFQNNFVIINHYIDRGISGAKENRPAFQSMMRDARLNLFSCILVFQLDRFARDRYARAC
ncbi:MAG: recombinase family protein [Elusimicrobiota bacterium]|nr:recombinase family protein [Elusimicrobiota bacterium]